jgi:trans-aconitate 2-methyltransferase
VSTHSGPRDWSADVYDRVSHPQLDWGLEVLQRLPLRGDEAVLDAGCGSGRVTVELARRLPRGRLVAVDASPSMVEKARAALPAAEVFLANLSELELAEPVDAVFSNAVFHWIEDHDALFARLHAALRPGGRLVAQCGGRRNVHALGDAARAVGSEPPFDRHLDGWRGPWNFTGPEDTAARMRRAGFADVETWLETRRVVPERPREYLETVTLGVHLARLPESLRAAFVDAVHARMPAPLTLDYVRLNIDARRPA